MPLQRFHRHAVLGDIAVDAEPVGHTACGIAQRPDAELHPERGAVLPASQNLLAERPALRDIGADPGDDLRADHFLDHHPLGAPDHVMAREAGHPQIGVIDIDHHQSPTARLGRRGNDDGIVGGLQNRAHDPRVAWIGRGKIWRGHWM